MKQNKPLPKPYWWKNTFFAISFVLLILGLMGLPFLKGDGLLKDPGQPKESNLWWVYLLGSVLALLNGYLSHRLTTQYYEEQSDELIS